jgi:hypothetical protein
MDRFANSDPLPNPPPCRGRERSRPGTERSRLNRETKPTTTAHLGTLPTSPCKGEVDRAAGGRGSHLLHKRNVRNVRGETIDIEGFPQTSIALQTLTPSPDPPPCRGRERLPLRLKRVQQQHEPPCGRGSILSTSSWPGASRPSTSWQIERKAWMPGSRPGMTSPTHLKSLVGQISCAILLAVPCAGLGSGQNKRREKSGFGSRFRAVRGVRSGREKISLSENRKSCLSSRHPASTRGAYASSRTLSAGCDGRKAPRDERRYLRTEEDVWSWHPLAGAKSAGDDLPATVTKRSWTPGRARRTPLKPFAQGRPGRSG